ncbi:unnamed protein product [Linum tenue]|uniref:RIN4 pathogenic type III effector avirulence factor Avr cleavage site domain-containing protein n=1 Tax=Linum tenue TaxID=586396 RepID=A0AAV0QA60_9ROSI|nr:unnamed protein product [Linum tenue]
MQDQGNNGWKAVPQFGEWESKGGASPSRSTYTTIFSEARAKRKMMKGDLRHNSSLGDLGDESIDLTPTPRLHEHHRHPTDESVVSSSLFTSSAYP